MTNTPVRNVVLVHGGFVDGSGWRGVYDLLAPGRLPRQRRAEPDPVARRTTSPPPSRSSTDWTAQPSSSGTPTAAPSSPRPARTRSRGARLHRRVRPRQGRVGEHPDRRPAARRPGAADPAARRTASCSSTGRSSHDSFAADVPPTRPRSWPTRRCPWGVDALGGTVTEPGVADQAELVPGRHRRPDDPAAGPASHVRARRRRRSSRSPAATRSTCRSRRQSPT